jgi:hemerythrin-like metal-binding protein
MGTEMDFAAWDDSLSTDHAEIDNDHKKLIEMINTLSKSIGLRNRDAILNHSLLELQRYTVDHFSREESLLSARGYPELYRHKTEHKYFLLKINEFMHAYKSGRTGLTQELVDFLKKWLYSHIHNSDMVALKRQE